MPAIHSLAQQLQERLEFSRGGGGVFAEQTQVATGLAEAEQGGEDLHAGGAAGLAEGIDLCAGGDLELGVGGFLVGGQFDLHDLLDLGGKLGEDLGFRAAEHPGPHATEKAGPGSGALAGEDGFLVAVLEISARSEVAGQEEFEEGPEVAHGIFERGAGENEARTGLHRVGGFGVLAFGIFDVLGLVEDDRGEREVLVMRDVAAEQGVARHDEVVAGDLGEKFFPVRTAEGEDLEAGGESCRFASPVPDERGGADHKVRAWCGLEIREGLNGFAKAHVVRQKPGLAGEQPRRAFDLIGTEARLERAEFFWGGFGGGRFLAAPLGDAGFEIPALGGRDSVAAAFL